MQILPQNAQHIGQREQQQDAFGFSDLDHADLVTRQGALAVVADGMGGMAMGQEASNLAKKVMLESFEQNGHLPPDQVLLQSLKTANDAVYHMASEAGLAHQVGTTLVAVLIRDGFLYWISVGDSRIYLFRNHELAPLNIEHTYARHLLQEIKSGQLTPEQAALHPERQALTSFVGMERLIEIDRNIKPFVLLPGDRLMLCSDGVHGTLTDHELGDILTVHQEDAAEAIVNYVLDRNIPHQDNATVAMLTYNPPQTEPISTTLRLPSSPSVTAPMPALPKHKPRNFRPIWIGLGLLSVLAVGVWWMLTSGHPEGFVYVGKRPGSLVTDLRGYFLQPNQLAEGTIEVRQEARQQEIKIGGQSARIPSNVKLAGIVRSNQSKLDQLVFQNAKNDSLWVLSLQNGHFIQTQLAGKLTDMERLGYFLIDPTIRDENVLAAFPPNGKLMQTDQDYMPKLTRWEAYSQNSYDLRALLALATGKLTPDSLHVDGKLWMQKVRLTETLLDRYTSLKQRVQNDDSRFKFKELGKSQFWGVEGLWFEDAAFSITLLLVHDLTLDEWFLVATKMGKPDQVDLPAVSFLRPDHISVTFAKPETKIYNMKLATGEWAIN